MTQASQYIRGKGIKPPTQLMAVSWVSLPIYVLAAKYEPVFVDVINSHDANNINATFTNPTITVT